MARTRQGLQEAVEEILNRYGEGGKRLSLRQAERRTGLSPATIGELAKGNARTAETIRRFAVGFGEDTHRLLLLAGYVPEEIAPPLLPSPPDALENAPAATPPGSSQPTGLPEQAKAAVEPEVREWLVRFGRALGKMSPGRERELWKDNLRRDTELIELCLERSQRG